MNNQLSNFITPAGAQYEIICPVCLQLLSEPVVIEGNCGQFFHQNCIKGLIDCPYKCPSADFNICKPYQIRDMKNIYIQCKCDPILKFRFGDIADHELICQKLHKNCQFCQQKIAAKDVDAHEKQCPAQIQSLQNIISFQKKQLAIREEEITALKLHIASKDHLNQNLELQIQSLTEQILNLNILDTKQQQVLVPHQLTEGVQVPHFKPGYYYWSQANGYGDYTQYKGDGMRAIWYQNGQLRSQSFYKDGKEEGQYREWHENSQLSYQCLFKFGKLEEEQKEWYENSQLKEQRFFKNGKLEGISKTWYKNGQLWSQNVYKDGKQEGQHREWYSNGQIKDQSFYTDGHPEGEHKEWHPNGQIILQCFYENGRLEGQYKQWYPNGQLKEQTSYQSGKLQGQYNYWHSNGQIAAQCFYNYGRLEGEDCQWHQDGQICVKQIHQNEQLIEEHI